ncbi:hypothetical protein ABIE48_000893 [Paenibacillus sp. OAE614]
MGKIMGKCYGKRVSGVDEVDAIEFFIDEEDKYGKCQLR